jgi:hypothetical protein
VEHYHTELRDLFEQLGLPADETSQSDFVNKNHGLAANVKLQDASFWTDQQREFLHVALLEDGEWAEIIDQLDALLRA